MQLRIETVNNYLLMCSVFEGSGDAETTVDENLLDST
jgi:hypothetical protein